MLLQLFVFLKAETSKTKELHIQILPMVVFGVNVLN